jgi:DNA invertase Pin-like site-specific DNA recombinase
VKPLRAVLYARVSTDTGEQDPESQLQALRTWSTSRGWRVVGEETDRVSSDPKRRRGEPPGLTRAIRLIEDKRADVLAIFAADRLVADPIPLLRLVARVQELGGAVSSLQDGRDLDTTTDAGELLTFIAGWYNRMRVRLIRAGTVAGLARARAAGRVGGRPRRVVDLEQLEELRARGASWGDVGEALGVGAETARRAWQARCRERDDGDEAR